jgi:hypothetical protein
MSTSYFKRKKISCTFPTFSYFSFFFLLFAVSIHNLPFSHFPSTWQLLIRAGKGGQWRGKSVPAGFIRTGNVVMDTLLTGIIIMCSSYLLALAQRLTSLDFVAMVRWIRYRSSASIIITGGSHRSSSSQEGIRGYYNHGWLKEIIITTCRRKPGSSQVVIGDCLYHRRLSKVIIIIIIGLDRYHHGWLY